jgi:hypothetical protein
MNIPPLIFLGDTHGFIEDFKKQREVISQFEPEFVLCERLENLSLKSEKDYKNLLNIKKTPNRAFLKESGKLKEFCYNKKIKLIGIDFKNFGFDKNLKNKIDNQIALNSNEERKLQLILKRRAENHIKKIKEYMKKTKKPLLVIIGAWHLRDDSELMRTFKNCKIIFPCNKKGNLLIEPSRDKEVFYCEKTKWSKK